VKHLIDAYKKTNNPFYSTNSQRSKKSPNSAYASYVIQPIGANKKSSNDEISFSSVCSQKRSYPSESATTVYVESQNYEFPINPDSSNSTLPSTPQNLIYSQVYPGNSETKNKQLVNKNTIKMHILPYGSLSGKIN
jgi:hypothetical protein